MLGAIAEILDRIKIAQSNPVLERVIFTITLIKPTVQEIGRPFKGTRNICRVPIKGSESFYTDKNTHKE